MKILESQNGLLSNYEVYQHLVDQQKRNKSQKRRVPGNLATLRTEVLTYLREKPSPLAQQEKTGAYTPAAIIQLLEKIQQENFQSDLAKGELLSILNIRPDSTALLSTVVEDMEERFTEDEQNKLVEIIVETLGRDDFPAEAEDEDAMQSIENGH
ncbi:RNA polymerase Rpb4-domain-containing protein [Cercophora newfieldiana]|uniref:DNA-directed RNA polymerase III subunit RPC9 n=1 Tax=Cercophora newfieldiana TaxID=92897 RepID=A0AA39YHR7_9PEZI|nr:RNA polymerase Rpb4-domain-containing protein [Cercophora newfieldiana]